MPERSTHCKCGILKTKENCATRIRKGKVYFQHLCKLCCKTYNHNQYKINPARWAKKPKQKEQRYTGLFRPDKLFTGKFGKPIKTIHIDGVWR